MKLHMHPAIFYLIHVLTSKILTFYFTDGYGFSFVDKWHI